MYRYSVYFPKNDSGELAPPTDGWTLHTAVGVGERLVCIWQSPYNSTEVEWGDSVSASLPVFDRVGEEPV